MKLVEIVQMTLEQVGHPKRLIILSQAARKYGVPLETIRRWADRGDVAVLFRNPEGRKELCLDEDSVARAAELYHRQPGRGYRPLNALKKVVATP